MHWLKTILAGIGAAALIIFVINMFVPSPPTVAHRATVDPAQLHGLPPNVPAACYELPTPGKELICAINFNGVPCVVYLKGGLDCTLVATSEAPRGHMAKDNGA